MDPSDIDIDGGHIAPIGDDKIPDVNQAHFCFSCETPINGLYCAACGQKNDDFRRSLFSLGKEFLGSITAIEGRIWRTWGALLFKPGKVAREYANGRRTHWSSPVRVYLAMSIILFGFLNIFQVQLISIDVDVTPRAGVEKPVEDLTAEDLIMTPGVSFFDTRKRINARNASRNFDLIALKMKRANEIKLDLGNDLKPEDTKTLKDTVNEEIENNTELSPEEIAEAKAAVEQLDKLKDNVVGSLESEGFTFSNIDGKTYQIDSWSAILFDIVKNPSRLNGAFYKYLPRIMFFMMPFTMLIGAIFIRGRGNAILYDHLVHAAYIHAFAFFVLLLGILLGLMFPGSPASGILFLSLLIYLPLSLKRMFARSWLKTIWTAYGVGAIYAFSMMLIMALLFGMQLLNTVTEHGVPLTP